MAVSSSAKNLAVFKIVPSPPITNAMSKPVFKLFISKIENFDFDAVKAGIDMLANRFGESIIILANSKMVVAKVSDGFVKNGINAGKFVGEIARATGANGGGRPNFAQGGVKDASKLDEILAKVDADIKMTNS